MKASIRRIALLLISAAVISLFTSGCQTTAGFGRDVENLGDNIQGGSGK